VVCSIALNDTDFHWHGPGHFILVKSKNQRGCSEKIE